MSNDAFANQGVAKAREVLQDYVQRELGLDVAIDAVSFREDFGVWEAWVSGPDRHIKAYIVRLGNAQGVPYCRHVTIYEPHSGRFTGRLKRLQDR